MSDMKNKEVLNRAKCADKIKENKQLLELLEKTMAALEQGTEEVALREKLDEVYVERGEASGKLDAAKEAKKTSALNYGECVQTSVTCKENVADATTEMFAAGKELSTGLGGNVSAKLAKFYAKIDELLSGLILNPQLKLSEKKLGKAAGKEAVHKSRLDSQKMAAGDLRDALKGQEGTLTSEDASIEDLQAINARTTHLIAIAKATQVTTQEILKAEKEVETASEKTGEISGKIAEKEGAVTNASTYLEQSNEKVEQAINLSKKTLKEMVESLGQSASASFTAKVEAIKNAFVQFKETGAEKKASRIIAKDDAIIADIEGQLDR
ncbi:MAG: hypothetical protein FWE31_00515 [Firmicutes bacterium]|nr:hypothetical protein [Bacillota bacterium]